MARGFRDKAVGNQMNAHQKTLRYFIPIFLVFVLFGLTGEALPQEPSASSEVRQKLTGRISTGWNYFSNANSLSSQLNALSEALALEYRVLGDSQKTRCLFGVDALAKKQLDGLVDTLVANPARNGLWVRQAYAGAGIQNGMLKVGRIMPLLQTADAYSIHGFSLEEMSLVRHLAFSAFGGKIYDDYSTSFIGEGYDFGGSLNVDYDKADAGIGVSAENHLGIRHRNAFLSAAYTPFRSFRITERAQAWVGEKQLGYSLTQVYWRVTRDLTVRSSFDYYDRTTDTPPPADILPAINRYAYAAVERKFCLSPTLRLVNSPDNSLDVSGTFTRQIGNEDLTSGAARLDYWDLNRNNDWVLDASVMNDIWMHDYRAGLSFEKDIPDLRLDAMLSGDFNDYAWNYRDSAGVAGSTNARTSFSVSLSAGFNLPKGFHTSLAVTEEFGDASNARTSLSARLTYLLR
jgi:hypothetical protein